MLRPASRIWPRVGQLLAEQEADEGRLARAGRADEEDELALVDLDGDVAQRDRRALVRLGDVLESDHQLEEMSPWPNGRGTRQMLLKPVTVLGHRFRCRSRRGEATEPRADRTFAPRETRLLVHPVRRRSSGTGPTSATNSIAPSRGRIRLATDARLVDEGERRSTATGGHAPCVTALGLRSRPAPRRLRHDPDDRPTCCSAPAWQVEPCDRANRSVADLGSVRPRSGIERCGDVPRWPTPQSRGRRPRVPRVFDGYRSANGELGCGSGVRVATLSQAMASDLPSIRWCRYPLLHDAASRGNDPTPPLDVTRACECPFGRTRGGHRIPTNPRLRLPSDRRVDGPAQSDEHRAVPEDQNTTNTIVGNCAPRRPVSPATNHGTWPTRDRYVAAPLHRGPGVARVASHTSWSVSDEQTHATVPVQLDAYVPTGEHSSAQRATGPLRLCGQVSGRRQPPPATVLREAPSRTTKRAPGGPRRPALQEQKHPATRENRQSAPSAVGTGRPSSRV